MADPLAQIIHLLRPGIPFSKLVSAAGRWRVQRSEVGRVYYCMILKGTVILEVEGHLPVTLHQSDFILVPEANNFTMSSIEPPPAGTVTLPVALADGTFRLGDADGPIKTQQLVGYCSFEAENADLLVALLPELVIVRDEHRLGMLASLIEDEVRAKRPAREIILDNLLQSLLIEALRATPETTDTPTLLKGLADPRLSSVLTCMHSEPAKSWPIAELAKISGLSRSALFSRFSRTLGVSPKEYLHNWRMALARDYLMECRLGISEIATKVGYGSVSAFSTAFTRHTGKSPRRYAEKNVSKG